MTANSGCEHSVTCSKQLEFMGMVAYIQEKLKASSSQWKQLILNHVLRMNERQKFQLIVLEDLWRTMQILDIKNVLID